MSPGLFERALRIECDIGHGDGPQRHLRHLETGYRIAEAAADQPSGDLVTGAMETGDHRRAGDKHDEREGSPGSFEPSGHGVIMPDAPP